MKSKLISSLILSLLLVFGLLLNSNASILQYEFDVKIENINVGDPNPWGLVANDVGHASITVDSSYGYSSSGVTTHVTNSSNIDYYDPFMSISVTFKGTTYTHFHDIWYPIYPWVTINNSDLSFNSFDLFVDDAVADDDNYIYIYITAAGVQANPTIIPKDEDGKLIFDQITMVTDSWGVSGEEIIGSTNPIPEPTTIMLLGIGLLSLAGISRRRE